jgi:hypothetical protein
MNPDPDPAPSVCEHPSFAAVFDKLLAEVPPIAAPPLELARRRLMDAEHTLSETRADGTENQVLHAMMGVTSAAAEVRRLESEAIK